MSIMIALVRPPETLPVQFPPFDTLRDAMDAIEHPNDYFSGLKRDDLMFVTNELQDIGYALVLSQKKLAFIEGYLPEIYHHCDIQGTDIKKYGRAWNTFYLEHDDLREWVAILDSVGACTRPVYLEIYRSLAPFFSENLKTIIRKLKHKEVINVDDYQMDKKDRFSSFVYNEMVFSSRFSTFYSCAMHFIKHADLDRESYQNQFLRIIRRNLSLLDIIKNFDIHYCFNTKWA